MRFVWLNLALALAVGGCFGSHGSDGPGSDAGPAPADGGGAVDAGPVPVDAGPSPVDAGPAPTCHGEAVSEAIVPRTLLPDQPLTMTLRSTEVGGCSCRPRIAETGPLSYGMEACDCCDLCACIDFGYEVGRVGSTLPVGDHDVVVGDEPRTVSVRDRSSCREATPLSLRIEPPRTDLISGGERIYWAVIETEESVCCVPPLVAVDQLEVGAAGTHLQALSCSDPDPCDCVGVPTRVESWYPLGSLGPGGYTVHAGDFEETFTVPGAR